jgi:hypothetical protein
MYSKSNLQFANYNEQTKTNDKLENVSQILVYQDKINTIYLTVNNAAPFEVYLVNTFHDTDYDVIDQLGTTGLESILREYLEVENV